MTNFSRLVAFFATCYCVSGHGDPLTVSTWGGSHAQVTYTEILRPFSGYFDVPINHVSVSDGGETGTPDIVELSLYEAIDACEKNEIFLLPVNSLDNTGSKKSIVDFVPNTLQPCAVGHSIWSTVAVFNKSRFALEEKPHQIAEFFDLDAYPGKRAIRKSPRVIAEWALTASGIANSDIYGSLSNQDMSWTLIRQKLIEIQDQIVWVDSDAEALELVHSGYAAFAMLDSSSLVRDSRMRGDRLGVIWDAAVTDLSMWAIPVNASNPTGAWEFIRHAASVNNSGKVASYFGYGPVRYSTLSLVGRNYQKMLPSLPENQRNILWSNSSWWSERSEFITGEFSQWVLDHEQKSELTLATVSGHIASGEIITAESHEAGGETLVHSPSVTPSLSTEHLN